MVKITKAEHDALKAVAEAARRAVVANYETQGCDIIGKQSLWTALADTESELRAAGLLDGEVAA
jgi:hypothetical protein